MTKRALVLQHDPTISLGNLEPVLREHGYDIVIVDATTPALDQYDPVDADLVVILGNEDGVYEKEQKLYIAAEEKWLQFRLAAERPTLGVCFGAQIMASALGGEVYKGDSTQVGYRSVEPTSSGESSPVSCFAGIPVVQWHGDTFTLPPGTTRLAGSADYENEAFGVGDWALAVQFHPEVTDELFAHWIDDGRSTIDALGLDPDELRAQHEQRNAAMTEASAQMLSRFLTGLERTR